MVSFEKLLVKWDLDTLGDLIEEKNWYVKLQNNLKGHVKNCNFENLYENCKY